MDDAAIAQLYTERNHLAQIVALLLRSTGAGSYTLESDDAIPGWPVLVVDTPAGQISWHLKPEDVRIFDEIREVTVYDGHSKEEAMDRLARLVSVFAAWPVGPA